MKVRTEDGSYKPAASGSAGAVRYTEQTLTEEQKAQARANIGAADAVASITTEQIDAILDA